MRNDSVIPQSGLVTEKTGLQPESRRRVTPEMRREVLTHFQALVRGHDGLAAVVQSLVNGDSGHAAGLLRWVQYGGQTDPEIAHLDTVERLVQASMCPHHVDLFAELHHGILVARSRSSDHGLESQGVAQHA